MSVEFTITGGHLKTLRRKTI